MKRIIFFVVFLAIAYLAFQYGVVFLKDNHNIDYALKHNEKEYFINERFIKNAKDEYYLITLKVDGKEFIFDVDNNFNKRRNIIEDVIVYEDKDLLCIYPVFLNKKTMDTLECNIDGKLYDYFAIKDIYKLDSFIETLPDYAESLEHNTKFEQYADLKVFTGNVLYNERIILYNYKNIANISSQKIQYTDFSIKDVYANKNGILVGKYYVVPDGNTPGVHSYMLILDVTTNISYKLPLRNELSSNYYINGVVDNKVYFFDKSNMTHYSINPEHNEIRIEGNKDMGCRAYKDGKWIDVTAYDMLNEEIKFTEDNSDININSEIVYRNNRYYYYKSGDTFYRSYVDSPEKSVQLFTYVDADIVKLSNNSIYFINGNTLYRYSSNSIIPLLERNEFKFNKTNIYDVYWEI